MEKKSSIQSGKRYLEDMALQDHQAEEKQLSSEELRRKKKAEEAAARRKARDREKLEEDIAELEKQLDDLEKKMCLPENLSEYALLEQLAAQLDETKKEYDSRLEEWMAME